MSDVAAEAIRGEVMLVEPGTDIVEAVSKQPGIVLLDRAKFSAWYEKLKADAPTDVDISTNKGRDVLRSFAARVRSEKAAIDKERLRLTADWRDMVSQANDAGKEIREQLDALAEEVRRPLTEWEEAEKARADKVEAIISGFKTQRFVEMSETAESIRTRGTTIYQTELDADVFQDRLDEAQREKDETVAHLKSALDRAVKAEAEAAELVRLREEAARKAEEEERVKAAQEQARKEAEELKVYEERRAAAEKAALEEIERERADAADRARREAEQAAEAERAEERRQHEAALAAEREAREKVEREAQAERDRIAAEKADRAAKAEKVAAEERARQENKEHRTKVKTAAKQAIMTCGADEETAQKIVLAMIAGEIPAVTIKF